MIFEKPVPLALLRYTLYPLAAGEGLAVQVSNTEWSAPATIVIVKLAVFVSAVGVVESFTLIVTAKEPDAVGTPESVPEELRVRPAGNAPALTDHEYGVTPPRAVRRVAV